MKALAYVVTVKMDCQLPQLYPQIHVLVLCEVLCHTLRHSFLVTTCSNKIIKVTDD
jgi:hypothetical protein